MTLALATPALAPSCRSVEPTVPVSVIQVFLAELGDAASVLDRFGAAEQCKVVNQIAGQLRGILENPTHRWVSVSEAAHVREESEETIRRKCRTGTAPFRFTKDDSGHYRIWLADLGHTEAA